MNKLKLFSYLFLFVAALSFTSCGDDDEMEPENEEEVITTLVYTLTSGADVATFRFTDLDGDGGNAPVVTVDNLAANTTYIGAIVLLNESETPAEDITAEVREEDADHQMFFEVSGANVTVAYTDQDDDGNPVGLASTLTTGDASTGTLKITLRHEPDKSASGVSGGSIDNAGGETDIEVTFDVNVQ